jgi:hypothetical protein
VEGRYSSVTGISLLLMYIIHMFLTECLNRRYHLEEDAINIDFNWCVPDSFVRIWLNGSEHCNEPLNFHEMYRPYGSVSGMDSTMLQAATCGTDRLPPP